MMNHNDCNQQGCWLVSFASRLSAPTPRFLIGDSVRSHFTDEHGVYRGCDHGQVVGMVWNPPNHQPGWWYIVQLYQIETSSHLEAPHITEIIEQELEPEP